MSLHPTPPTHPNPTCYVASNMCATSTMSLHPTPPTHPPQPHVLRSIQHVCNFSDVITPHPTHPPNPTHVTGVKENAFIPPYTVSEARSETRRYVRLEPKTNEKQFLSPKLIEFRARLNSRSLPFLTRFKRFVNCLTLLCSAREADFGLL